MQLKLVLSNDGSHTLYREDIDEHYHSTHGAIQEALHVFIDKGLNEVSKTKGEITILEIGFGTGLNALLTCLNSRSAIKYIGIEAFPVEENVLKALNYITEINREGSKDIFEKIHAVPWNRFQLITDNFSINKIEAEIQGIQLDKEIDLIYYDAFGPNSQAEMWDIEIFRKLYNTLAPEGIFVTYCAKGQVRRDLQSVGFTVERLEGPPGKREMLRARKL